jgi:hypothetical protein
LKKGVDFTLLTLSPVLVLFQAQALLPTRLMKSWK